MVHLVKLRPGLHCGKIVEVYEPFLTNYSRVANGPTCLGPNPKIKARTRPESENQFEAQIMPKKPESKVRSEKFRYVAKLF